MLLCDKHIRKLCVYPFYCDLYPRSISLSSPMIESFQEGMKRPNKISYGLTTAGYDLRMAPEYKIYSLDPKLSVVDPKQFNDNDYVGKILTHNKLADNEVVILPPHSYMLTRSFEYLRIPKELKARCVGKSTIARCGILINTTPLEPGWNGYLTIEVANLLSLPVKIYPMEGIAQIEFETLTDIPEESYSDKKGIYQDQVEITTSRVAV